MEFYQRLKGLRQRHRITQNELADILGVKPSTVANYESNRNEPSFDKLRIISSYFKVSIDYLLGQTEDCYPCIFRNISTSKLDIIYKIEQLEDHDLPKIHQYINFLQYQKNTKNSD